MDALDRNPKIILVGTSGSGKTYAIKFAVKEITQQSGKLCFLIPLKNYTHSLNSTIKAVLGWHDNPDKQVVRLLQKFQATLLLDGLNEVTKKDQEQCINEIQILLDTYEGSICVSHPSSDQSYFGFDYPTFTTMPLDKQKIERTIISFFESQGEKHKADWLLKHVRGWETKQQEDFDNLAKLPINLQFLLELVQNDDFTYTSLNDIYGQVIQKRLERTKLHSQRGQIPVDIKTECLMNLAYQAIIKDQPLRFQREFARNVFIDKVGLSKTDSTLALEEIIRSGLLLEGNEFLLEWPHSSFKDYLAGRQLFNLVELEKSFDDFPLEKIQGANAAAHATKLLTTQSQNIEKRSAIFLSLIKRIPSFETMKMVAGEYHTALEYYSSTGQGIECDAKIFSQIKWGERFLEAYSLITNVAKKSGFPKVEIIPSPNGLDVYFDENANFCLILFSGGNGIHIKELENLKSRISNQKKRKKDSRGFCLFAPFLLMLDPEIVAYIEVGLWLRFFQLDEDDEHELVVNWHSGLVAFMSLENEWTYWNNKNEMPKSNTNLVAEPKETMEFLVRNFGRNQVAQITANTDIITKSKKMFLSWQEIYMPITFQIEPSKVQDTQRVVSTRLGGTLVRTIPDHHISLLLLPAFPSTLKIDFDTEIFVPFPVTILNRFYYLYYEQVTFLGGKTSSFVHLRG